MPGLRRMIRPFTFLTAALALGSGFYLYQAKHRTQLLDARISAITQQTAKAESRIAVLRAEWALENAPSRLADLAAHYLLLVPLNPAQAVSMGNLASRLPPPAEPGATTPGATSPLGGEPDLVAMANGGLLARYASLVWFAGAPAPAPAATPEAAVAELAAPPPVTTTEAPRHEPSAASTFAVQHTRPAAPSTVARLSPQSAGAPAAGESAERVVPQAVSRANPHGARPALLAATPPSPMPLRMRPAPILTSALGTSPLGTSALGGSYPALPPPAPLSGSH
ncbi:MAG: cell division protein FtsL [Acetobacteraceae bacterium]